MSMVGASVDGALEESALVELAQAGDDRAFAMLVALCEPMLRTQVAHFRLSRTDAEDMSQEGLLGLLAAVRTFHPEKGVPFRAYAAVCVRNRLLSVLRRRAARANEVPVGDVVEQSSDAVLPDPAALLTQRESADRLLARVREQLSGREYAVLVRYLDGESYAQIAASVGLTPKSVDNALQRARRKLQKSLLF